jgi:hypothetical protein
MDATRTQGASVRSLRPLVLVVIAFAIVLSIALVRSAAQETPADGGIVSNNAPIAPPKSDPAAQVHLRVAEALNRLERQESRGR